MQYTIYKTVKGTDQPFQKSAEGCFVKDLETENNIVNIVPDAEYQTVEGFGGAFTEAGSTTLDRLSHENREKVLRAYFDPETGNGYSFCRTHISSCDFSLGNYSYIEDGDTELKTFSIERDKKSLIPMILDAKKYGSFRLMASPWSPPAFMKTNNDMNHGGKLKPEYYEAWSNYYLKYLEACRKEGIEIDALSVQNEAKAVQTWDSCIYTAEEEKNFVRDYLGEKLKKEGKALYFWDHNRERVCDRAKVMFGDPKARELADGIAVHWYSGDHFDAMRIFHDLYPDKKIIMSECCREYSRGEMDAWEIGESYAHEIFGCFRNYCNAFCDWNMLLNIQGGPNHVGNFCDAPIMADTDHDCVEFHSSYYYIGHFSRFVRPGAVRLGTTQWTDRVETVAFRNPDGTIVMVLMNKGDENVTCHLRIYDDIVSDVCAEAHSIMTVLIRE